MKKQTNNFTRARLDYFLLNDNSTDLVKKVGIGRVCYLSLTIDPYIFTYLFPKFRREEAFGD